MKFRVIVLLLLATAVFVFSQEDDTWYHDKPIGDIIFSGLSNVSQSELDGLMNPYKGRIFTYDLFWEIQGRLYALEYFDRIEPSLHRANHAGSEVIIRFTVTERPVIGRINFIGISGATRRELNQVIISRVNDIFNQAKVRVDIEAIINRYLEKGYPNVVVTASESIAGDSRIILNFHITENEMISISRIEFQGNTRFSERVLRGQLSLRQRSIINNGAFQEAKLLADIESITRYYGDRGYIDAVVRDVTRTYEADSRRTNLVLTFLIEEGAEFRFGGVTFEGNVIFSTEQLSRLITSKQGDVVNMTRLEMDMQRVADLYFENGYIFNSLTRTPFRNDQTNEISYSISIIERSRAYIENIIIIGNEKTRDSVILREIPLEPGDVFSRTKVLDAMRNLFNLQFFSMVMPDTLPGSTENLMDLIFTVEEQPTTDIQFGLTFSGSADPDSFPISGLIKWTDRNLAGTGNELGVEVNSTVIDSTSIALNYMHRWIFGLPLSVGIDFTADFSRRLAHLNNGGLNNNQIWHGSEVGAYPDGFNSYGDYLANRGNTSREYLMTYDQWYLSLGFSTGYRWLTAAGNIMLRGGIRFGMTHINYDEANRPFDPALRAGNNRWTPRNSFWLNFALDQRDIFYDPSSGYFFSQRFGFNGIFPGEREYYIRSDTRAQYYLTLWDLFVTDNWSFKGVLAIQVGLSAIFRQPGRNLSIEDANKLAIDGMFIGRGWREDFHNKGLLLLDNWIELRIPLARGILAWDFFFDAVAVDGIDGDYFRGFSVENMRFGFGGGLRFTIPQFPIRLALAKRFKVENGSVRWMRGGLFSGNNPSGGIDLVMSFAISF